MKYYAAYGSNMNREQMKYRAPTAEAVGVGRITGYRLAFRYYLTIEKTDEPYIVPVVIWKIDEEAEVHLDRYEGFPQLYRKEMVKVECDRKELKAIIYIMNGEMDLCPYAPPSDAYLQGCFDGATDFGILEAYDCFREALKYTVKMIKRME